MRRRRKEGPSPGPWLPPATPGAQHQIDEIRQSMNFGLRAMLIAGLIVIAAGALGAWQVHRALDGLQDERLERIGAQSSINAYFCRQIDEVGDGVASLVAVSLRDAPPRRELTQAQRAGFDRFTEYLRQQRRPPRCHRVALRLAELTGADPAEVTITPLRIYRPRRPSGG